MVQDGSKHPKPKLLKTRPASGHGSTLEAICVTCFESNRNKCTLKRFLPSYIDRHRTQVHKNNEIDVISFGDPRAAPILKVLKSNLPNRYGFHLQFLYSTIPIL